MTRTERDERIQQLTRENAAILSTPLMSEGAISPTQINRMGGQAREQWQRHGQHKMMLQAEIRNLRRSDEELRADHEWQMRREADSTEAVARSRYQFLKSLEPYGFRGIKGSKRAYRAEFEQLRQRFEAVTA